MDETIKFVMIMANHPTAGYYHPHTLTFARYEEQISTDSIIVDLHWNVESDNPLTSYHVSVTNLLTNETSMINVINNSRASLMLNFNILYNVSISEWVCGEIRATNYTLFHYGE